MIELDRAQSENHLNIEVEDSLGYSWIMDNIYIYSFIIYVYIYIYNIYLYIIYVYIYNICIYNICIRFTHIGFDHKIGTPNSLLNRYNHSIPQ